MERWLIKVLFSDDAEVAFDDSFDILQLVLREAFVAVKADTRYYLEQVKSRNKKAKAIRDYIRAILEAEAKIGIAAREQGIDPCGGDDASRAALSQLFDDQAVSYERDPVACLMCVPDRAPSHDVTNFTELEREIKNWEQRLNELSTDGELANVKLQENLQKQQQLLQMISNISKVLYDTAQSITEKCG